MICLFFEMSFLCVFVTSTYIVPILVEKRIYYLPNPFFEM